MWIVRIALSRPYTFIVLAILIFILGPLTILRTPTDIFPNIDIPVVSVVWGYAGLAPDDMANRIVGPYERTLTTTVSNIEHIESQSLNGIGVVKIFFQPDVQLPVAIAEVTAISQTVLKNFPNGTTPPLVLAYNASSVPVLQLALSSSKLSEQQIFDAGNNFIRTQLATVEGASIPYPYGGKIRQIQVDLDPDEMQAHGVSPQDVSNAIGAQNLIIPAGTEKIGVYEYNIKLNGSPTLAAELNAVPVKYLDGATVTVGDVAHVRDGFPPQTNIVRVDGQRAVLMTIQKTGNSSTLDIVDKIQERLPLVRTQAPEGLKIAAIGDQSVFVRAAITGVVREAVIAAALTGLMILIFLFSWRSTVIITISIPLAMLASIMAMSALGETINLMTLGGLALAVGILVDDATVAIENINWHLEQGKEVETAILDGAAQIAVPALVSTLCICIVFMPMFLLSGVARYLFVPMAEAVVFAMLASYVLSRTLVPTLAKYWLKKRAPGHEQRPPHPGLWWRFQMAFEGRFEKIRDGYHDLLEASLERRGLVAAVVMGFVVLSLVLLYPNLGTDFFPQVDGGQLKLHLRAHTGTRIEETAALCDHVEATIRKTLPAGDITTITDNIGIPYSGINLSYSNSAPIGPGDADINISLAEDHQAIAKDRDELRRSLAAAYPGVTFSFLPADIVGQVLNFGLPAPIDVQVIGQRQNANLRYADQLLDRIRKVPGIADPHIQQAYDYPQFQVTVDRERAQALGLAQRDVANNMLVSLSGTGVVSPTYWQDPTTGVQYPIVVQTPQYRLTTLDQLRNIPIDPLTGGPTQILGGVADITRGVGPGVVSHYNVQPLIDIYANVSGRDLGGVASDINKILASTKSGVPRGSVVVMRGQVATMQASFTGLFEGLLFAIVLVYLLIVVNFQSWLDPFIIITALPASLAGEVWMLFLTDTTRSVPALTGAIMSVGVATANSILVVSFARERMEAGDDAKTAALAAGFSRFRPVLMTALAMIIGMLPMSLGLGEGGEQNAPLGRAVIGGLLFATAATLFFVPLVFSYLHGRREGAAPEQKSPAA